MKANDTFEDVEELRRHLQLVITRFNLLNLWLKKYNARRTISDYLKNKKVTCIGIYGLGTFAERLIEDLTPSQADSRQIEIAYIVDGRWELQGGRYDGIPVIHDYLIRKYTDVQLVVVTPFHVFDAIEKKIKDNLTDHKPAIIAIDELINEL